MRKLLTIGLALLGVAAMAADDTVARASIEALRSGSDHPLYRFNSLYVGGGTVTLPARAVSLASLAGGLVGAVSTTNGATVTLVPGKVNVLTPAGQANGLSNQVVIANFATADLGVPTKLVVAPTATNTIKIVRTGNYYGASVELSAGQMLEVVGVATNAICGE